MKSYLAYMGSQLVGGFRSNSESMAALQIKTVETEGISVREVKDSEYAAALTRAKNDSAFVVGEQAAHEKQLGNAVEAMGTMRE